jgi:hypothetical protein
MTASAYATEQEIVGHFESLGDNCEFGLVQRLAGVERLGFFRFNFAALPALLRALDCDFADVAAPEQVEIYVEPNQELMVRVRHYGFEYHTHTRLGGVDIELLRTQQIKAIRFLVRKFLDDLRSGEKIFVRKGMDCTHVNQLRPLLRALQRHGPVTLLWVVTQDDAHPAGSVEVVEAGLLKGYIDRFAPYDDAYDLSLVWFDICRGALHLWRNGSPAGTLHKSAGLPVGANLIRHSDSFGGNAWWQMPHAHAVLSDAVPRLHELCAVMEHGLLQSSRIETGAIHGNRIGQGLSSGSTYVASLSVWLPADFGGAIAGAVVDGFESLQITNANLTRRETWQRVSVTARVPTDVSSASPALFLVGPVGTRIFSTCWKLELGSVPTPYQPPVALALHPPEPQVAEESTHRAATPTRAYRCVTLDELVRSGAAEAIPYLPETHLGVPPLLFGGGQDAAGIVLHDPPVSAHLLRHAEVHGRFGVVTCGDLVVGPTAAQMPMHEIVGAMWDDETRLRLPEYPRSAPLRAAYHLLCAKQDDYLHWLLGVLCRFSAAEFQGFGVIGSVDEEVSLLRPPLDVLWKRQSLDLLVPPGIRQAELAAGASVAVERLIYIPDLAGGGLLPHRRLLTVFDRMRAAAYAALGSEPGAPWRKLAVLDSAPDGTLANRDELVAQAVKAGFEQVALGSMGVAEQIRLFAEATHIVAAHGAGLTNLAFCRPGTLVCELQSDGSPQAEFRHLAALRGLRYGRLVGSPSEGGVYRVSPDELAAVLANSSFRGT